MKKFKFKKKWIVIAIIVIAAAFMWINGQNASKNVTKTVEAGKVEKGDVETFVEVTGNIEANDSAEITSNYNYEIVEINVKEGDKVQKNQILARLDTKDLKNEIAILEKEVAYEQLRLQEQYSDAGNVYTSTESLKLALDDAKLRNTNAKIAFNQAVDNLKKQEDLLAAGAVPEQDVQNAKNAKEQAQIALEQSEVAYKQAQESMEKGQHDINNAVKQATPKSSAKASLSIKLATLQQKREKLNDLNIKSPISGTVTRVYAKLGRTAKDTENNRAMFIIEDESKKFLVAKVGQYDISDVKLNQEVTITSDVLGKDSAKGTVSRISPTGEKSSTGSNTIVVPVKILVTKSDNRLITGVSAKAKIKTDSMKNVLKTSFENILTQGDKNFVFVIEDGAVKKVEIKTGLASTFDTQIISKDLKEGTQVVKNPDETLMDGEKVIVNDPNKAPAGVQGAPQGGQQGGVQYVDSGSNQEASQNSSESK